MIEAKVKVKMTLGPAYRDELGRFTSAQKDQYERNRGFRDYLRADLGRRIENHVNFGERKSASTGTLMRASADIRNTVVSLDFVGIGVESFLNSSAAAKYWRTFEEGSLKAWGHTFVGQKISVVTGPNGEQPERPNAHYDVPGIRSSDAGWAVVKKDIAPAGIYTSMGQTKDFENFGVHSARKFLARIFGEENLVVRNTGTPAGPFAWSTGAGKWG